MHEVKRGTAPIKVEETAGRKAYCQCGWSATLPYCDGSHGRLGLSARPIVCEISEAGKKFICQCGQSATLPFCDGAHKRLSGYVPPCPVAGPSPSPMDVSGPAESG